MERLISYRGTDEILEFPLGLVFVRAEALKWLKGIRGELFMAKQLDKLGPDWTVMHSVLVGERSDIDHIVIGPAGVFPINTKRLVGRDVFVSGGVFRSDELSVPFLRRSADESDTVVRLLNRHGISAPVLPIVAISGARKLKVKSPPRWRDHNIGVAKVEDIVGKLRGRTKVLSSTDVARIADLLADSRVWSYRTTSDAQDGELLRAFRRIDRGVSRLNWLAIGGAGVVMIAITWIATTISLSGFLSLTSR